jgi:hypothetical protein
MKRPSIIQGVDVDAVAATVTACPGVVQLSDGRHGEVATYLPGGQRVGGVRVVGGGVEVHVIAGWVRSLPELADQVRIALCPIVVNRPVMVAIDDVVSAEGTVVVG